MSLGRMLLLGVGGLVLLVAVSLVVRLAVAGGRTRLAMTQEVAAPPEDVFPYLVEPDLLRTKWSRATPAFGSGCSNRLCDRASWP